MNISKSRFDTLLKRLYFKGPGILSSGASNEQKKEYIKIIFDDAFDNYSEARDLITKTEWEEIKSFLVNNKKDILTEQDIEVLSKIIELELR
jgi:predicted transcriptional regulator